MLFFALSSLVIASVTWACPSKESIFPCTCKRPDDSAYVTCPGLFNDQDLLRVTGSLGNKNYVYSFVIENSVLNFIPSDAFKGTRFVEVEIKNTSLMALTDTDIAFEGLENHLEILLMTDCTLMNEWDWSIFRNLRKLMRMDIVRVNLRSIDEDLDFINTETVTDISFADNLISYVHDTAFAKFENLKFLSLSKNQIVEMKRSMIHDPATQLLQLELSDNMIEKFPIDMFTGMPMLESLSIGNNKILVLEEKTFLPVWSQLDGFNAMGNELRCDCRMAWIANKENTKPKDLRAICAKPQEVKGKNLKDLSSGDLWCYFLTQ